MLDHVESQNSKFESQEKQVWLVSYEGIILGFSTFLLKKGTRMLDEER